MAGTATPHKSWPSLLLEGWSRTVTRPSRSRPISEVLAAALDYARRGWSVVPARPNQKAPLGSWTRWQHDRATEDQIRKWFDGCPDLNVGLVLGTVSGRLAVRDFDDAVAYRRWGKKHPVLARRLPTVRTHRGFHVYFRATDLVSRDLCEGEFRA